MQKIATCLMFAGDQHGRAEKAMTLYTSVFEDSQVLSVDRYGSGEEEAEGTVRAARFVLAGREFLAMDSGRPHPFGFTPAMSLVVEFERPQNSTRCSAASPRARPCSWSCRNTPSAGVSDGWRTASGSPGN